MFKSSFSKYLTAFIIIILVSFFMLSGIITSIIRTHVTSDKRSKLEMSTSIVADHFESQDVEQLDRYIAAGEGATAVALIPLVNLDYNFNVLVTAPSGKVLLSTILRAEDGTPGVLGELGTVDISAFDGVSLDSGEYLVHEGVLKGITDEKSIMYAKAIRTGGVTRGYVIAISSTEREDRLISITRNAVINSSVWVMLAAVIATYFITERIIHPLKKMTKAAKRFGKGDFSERVEVYGKDEVSELAVAFNNMAESLDSLEKMRNSFLANVSHDLRTPMTTISGFIEGIVSGAIPPEQHNHYLGVISSEVHRLSRLVTELLDVSRLESGDRKFLFADFDLAEVGRLIIISFEKQLEEKRLDVEFISDEDEMIAYADKDAIYQVLYNLCHNAIKFSREGGRFVLKITKFGGKKLSVSVYDEGQIIDEEDAKHIFDRFYKTDKSRGLDKNGVGLGLYISKTIVEAHGEKIEIIPHPDGCEFVFTLKEGSARHKSKDVYIEE